MPNREKFAKSRQPLLLGFIFFSSVFVVFSDHPLNANEKQAATKITIRKIVILATSLLCECARRLF